MIELPKLPTWQPLTFGGVAAFARAGWSRLLLLQAIVAAFIIVGVVVFLTRCWFPVLTQAVESLSDFGVVRGAQLAWPKQDAIVLAENRFLGLVVDLDESGATGQVADLQVEFTRQHIKFVSLLGYTSLPYPSGVEVEVNRQRLDPWWNAWRPAFLFGAILGTLLFLFASWWLLATLYALPVRVLAWFANREASLGKSWRLAAAALLPGAVWMGAALLLYAVEQLSLIGLGVAFGLHFIIPWVYLVGAPFSLPRIGQDALVTGVNPFTIAPAPQPPTQTAPTPASANPFQSGDQG
ncbi:MAG: hypothetical protein RL514_4159 [Verrucomicrobiota bacterium]